MCIHQAALNGTVQETMYYILLNACYVDGQLNFNMQKNFKNTIRDDCLKSTFQLFYWIAWKYDHCHALVNFQFCLNLQYKNVNHRGTDAHDKVLGSQDLYAINHACCGLCPQIMSEIWR